MSTTSPDETINVLLVEDNPGDVRLTQEAFKSTDIPVDFHVVHDGKEATEYFQQCEDERSDPHPDIVLLDLNLPRVDGFTVLEILETELDYPPPPVLVLSSSETEEDVIESYENSAKAYLTKPDDLSDYNSMAQAIEDFWIKTVRRPPVPS